MVNASDSQNCRGFAVSGLRSLSRLWEGGSAFALCARGVGCSPPRLASPRSAVAGSLFAACPLCGSDDLRGCFRVCPLCGPFPMTSEVGTDLQAVRPPGTGLVVLTVESACSGEWRYFVMFAGVALSGKSPYLGGSRVWLSLWQEPGMWPEDLRGRFRACPLCGPFPLEVRGGCSPMTSEVGTDLRAVRPCFGLSLAWG